VALSNSFWAKTAAFTAYNIGAKEPPQIQGRILQKSFFSKFQVGAKADTPGTHRAGVGRHHDLPAAFGRRGPGQGPVLCGLALKEDFPAQGALAHDPIKVVADDRVLEAGKNVIQGEAFLNEIYCFRKRWIAVKNGLLARLFRQFVRRLAELFGFGTAEELISSSN
jgi:hypothetical protein